ncbi:MAG: TIGR02186 family protein, partial [Hyphomicrobiaceae bacterium]
AGALERLKMRAAGRAGKRISLERDVCREIDDAGHLGLGAGREKLNRGGPAKVTARAGSAFILAVFAAFVLAVARPAAAQTSQRPIPLPPPKRIVPTPPSEDKGKEEELGKGLAPESVQADISTRNIVVTSSFSGTEIVVFGAVHNSRQQSAEAGLYDVVIVVVGTPTRLVARRKSRVAGMWLNTDSLAFDSVPSYYAIASTRPLDEVASPEVLKASGIGFDYVPMTLPDGGEKPSAAEVDTFRNAIVRLKRHEQLYATKNFAVSFIGPSLFRAAIALPATVVVGPFETRVYLFRNGELLSNFSVRLNLERRGLEEALHGAAFQYPFIYGATVVFLAMGAGLLFTAVFRGLGR